MTTNDKLSRMLDSFSASEMKAFTIGVALGRYLKPEDIDEYLEEVKSIAREAIAALQS